MSTIIRPSVFQLDQKITGNPELNINNTELDKHLQQLSQSANDGCIDNESIDGVISFYKKTIVKLEHYIWHSNPTEENIKLYQDTFKTLEGLYKLKPRDDRYNFKIVIPVADRPQHLKQCLASLLTLCQSYEYGGCNNGQFSKISVLIADDSREKDNIQLHKSYCEEFSNAGITTEYFGLEEQLSLVNKFSGEEHGLQKIISSGDNIEVLEHFSHKGASIMRNITYLKLKQSISDNDTLIYFIDSDQEFCVNIAQSDNNFYAINYFHYLNENFKQHDISILTGKVVGDPPVSPAVMAANFQQDIRNFISTMASLNPGDACQFHQHETANKDDAAYHDMANLFGFSNQEQVFNYHCTLTADHDNADCFCDFSNKLDHFFYGEHPTRKTMFNYENGFTRVSPARTVYTGNYVIKPDTLVYFIPFATLKLRMAGPVLGRILKTRLKHGFVSANLPMLHNRTIDETGQSEFRPGVVNNKNHVDLGSEFVRQFYGDVMLFTMEQITNAGFPDTAVDRQKVETILKATYNKIKDNYIEKHNKILQLKSQISDQLANHHQWWNSSSVNQEKMRRSIKDFDDFLKNIQSNFDDNTLSYLQCISAKSADKYLDNILQAIMHYQRDLATWQKALDHQH